MWKDFFLYTKSERRGIVILLFFIVLVLLFRFTMPYWNKFFMAQMTSTEFEDRIFRLNDSLISQKEKQISVTYFSFDPNSVTKSELALLGFSEYQQKSFLGYRSKIGAFNSKADILKVYGIDSTFMSAIEPYILFKESKVSKCVKPDESIKWINFNIVDDQFWLDHISSNKIRDSIQRILTYHEVTKSLPLYKIKQYSDEKLFLWLKNNISSSFSDSSVQHNVVKFEINGADTIALKGIRGVGSVLANRIVKFRNLLGGFYKKEQLKEVYGISEEIYNNIASNIYVEEKLVHKLNPFKDGLSATRKHPYFSDKQSKELYNLYRKNTNPSVLDVSLLNSINPEDLDKMKMYLLLFE